MASNRNKISRRAAVLGGAAAIAALAVRKGEFIVEATSNRMPVVYLPHGGGPWPFVELGFPKAEVESLSAYLRSLPSVPKTEPNTVLVVSAHWEEDRTTVMTSPSPSMLYDYYGFPPQAYTITWPAKGEPHVAAKARQLLEAAGFETATDPNRGFDHGTFVPLKVAYPEANVPTVQLSLKAGLDPAEHLAIGRALAPLRDQGVFIVGSGMSFHNMRAFRDPRHAEPQAQAFDHWLRETSVLEPVERDRRLVHWADAPSARYAHPREEHLLPLMVVAGAAMHDRGTVPFQGNVFGLPVSAVHFG